MQADNSGHTFAFKFIKLSVCNFYIVLVTNILHTYNLNGRKSALALLISHCVIISRTNKCLSQRWQIFRKFCPEPQISRRHACDMQQAASCGPTNISATLQNLVVHDLCKPYLSYNNTSATVCNCRLPPACKILSVKIGSRLKQYCITHFSSYRTENTVPILYKVRELNLFRSLIGIWCKKNKKYNTMWKILGLLNVTNIVARSYRWALKG